ncbi:MAG: alpha-glucosidase [Hyphomonadaceae bacterium]|nr:MAG: alpha-glucosidase [Hyphomonadaceae bacterium]KAF0185961.1 MAG: alpha-glucosidase [Hyphomonadaceae bacterium]
MNRISVAVEIQKIMEETPWWSGAAIYQIYPRSFLDTDADGIGDLKGITAKLGYISSLGVAGIWISPFFASPMKDFGYDVSDYCAIDPMFGTMADFDELLEKAHALGLKVIIDQVYSHTSDQHEWFTQSRSSKSNPKADWYVWADPKPDGSPPSNWQSVFNGSAWTWDARRCQYYLHNFLEEQPDLNLHNPEVQTAILDVARFWLDKGVDGFRLDALNFAMHDPSFCDNPPKTTEGPRTRPFDYQEHIYNQSHPDIVKFIERLAGIINEYEGRFTVAEVGGENAAAEMRQFIHGDNRLNTAYGFTYLYAEKLTPRFVKAAIENWQQSGDEYWPSWAFSNHDAPRAASRWAQGRDIGKMARLNLILLASLRGNIFLYQGEELGLEQAEIGFEDLADPEAIANWPKTLGRDGARTPIPWNEKTANSGFSGAKPWLPIDARHDEKAVSAQNDNPDSVLNWTREVMALRREYEALMIGTIEVVAADDNLLALRRQHGRQEILCVFNLGFEIADYALGEEYEIIALTNGATQEKLPPLGAYWARLK